MVWSNRELNYSWSLPYYSDENNFIIVCPLDPQRYEYKNADWFLVNTSVDIQMAILTEWLDAGWCAADVGYSATGVLLKNEAKIPSMNYFMYLQSCEYQAI